MKHLLETLQLCEFGSIDTYVTARGKEKLILDGTPSKEFWDFWRKNKDGIKACGITVQCEKETLPVETKTGLPKKVYGSYRTGKTVKTWFVRVWINPKNQGTVFNALGIEPEKQTMQPLAECPF